MNTALIYLPITGALGAALWMMGSGGWRSCIVICLGLAIMTQLEHAAYPWLLALVIWAAVAAVLIFWTGAPLLACACAIGSAASYTIAMLGGSALATVWTANVFGVGMLLALLGSGIIELVGRGGLPDRGGLGGLALAGLRERGVAPMAAP